MIFRGLKSITLDDPQQKVLLRLAQANVAIYSPHTAIDAAAGGLNDWLASLAAKVATGGGFSSKSSVVKPIANSNIASSGSEAVGYGRLVTFGQPVEVASLLRAFSEGLGPTRPGHVQPRPFMVARPRTKTPGSASPSHISSVAVCAGSGWDVLKDCEADAYVMGETSHHNALRASMLGKWLITTFHSNSERYYLQTVLVRRLSEALKQAVPDVKVVYSEEDRDPFEVMMVHPENGIMGQPSGL